jgi:predicted TIM-barrel fold metal-dependent hydrolase
MRTITLEEHFATRAYLEGPGGHVAQHGAIFDRLCDLDELRIAEMDEAGIDVQVLSLTAPGIEQLGAAEARSWARSTNDHLADAVRRHPDRFAGLAALPMADPPAAADELSRMVGTHGFVGAVINGHIGGRYLDDEFFWPVLGRAEDLNVPIYLHPTPPPRPVIESSYTGNFSAEVSAVFASAGWGWHIETATHLLRMVLAGVFDRYPRLRMLIGHMGEGLPFMLPRLERTFGNQVMPVNTGLDRPIGEYFRENVRYTFSGFNFAPDFDTLLAQVGVERIMFSADYPYQSMAEARKFLDDLPLDEEDRHRIAHRNAETLLNLTGDRSR